ncbi:hypothetical protein M422DRAFT_264091 [Sphaerobolus stellatus SS14]|uniref:Carboxylesterase type B domain-containing protein n=1 Tax=Sphaerobolus stellatus (strain SS14) TaxID=990650 RepID=A0A0C9UXF8_SPHS4|nr:hypothetical protein M422DRAFT_264091 [Sphaerobolus stellatus SS14]
MSARPLLDCDMDSTIRRVHLLWYTRYTPTVKLGKTTLTGRDITGLGLDFFGGILFAEPPVGKLRLKPTVLKKELDVKTFDASNFGLSCLSSDASPPLASEDCLTINVYRPTGVKSKSKLPVIIFRDTLIWDFSYGGGFHNGVSSIYNTSAIVVTSVARGTPVIYVSFNYRLEPLGFPQGKEADKRGILNLAIKDQLAALHWVQENIETFGGDKKRVAAFGQSAGAIMTAILFLDSTIEKLARAAIFESGSAASALTFNAERRQVDWQNFVSAVPACASRALSDNTLDCLRQANTTEINAGLRFAIASAPETYGFDPTIDGAGGLYPDFASNLFARGKFAKLPFIAGTNLDEGTLFTNLAVNDVNVLRQSIMANFSPPTVSTQSLSDAADDLLRLYPAGDPTGGSPFNTGNETFGLSPVFKTAAAIQGDVSFHSQRRLWIQTAAKAGVKTYGYLFTEPTPGAGPYGVVHGSEVLFIYGAPSNPTAEAAYLSQMMINYWVSFATSLGPNDGKGVLRPNWPQYTTNNQVLLELNGANTTVIPDTYRKEQIDYINSIPLV